MTACHPPEQAGRHDRREVTYEWNVLAGAVWWGPGLAPVLGHVDDGTAWSMDAWTDLVHPADAPRIDASLLEAIEAGRGSWRARYRLRRGDGSYVPVVDRAVLVRDHAGKVVRLMGRVEEAPQARVRPRPASGAPAAPARRRPRSDRGRH